MRPLYLPYHLHLFQVVAGSAHQQLCSAVQRRVEYCIEQHRALDVERGVKQELAVLLALLAAEDGTPQGWASTLQLLLHIVLHALRTLGCPLCSTK